MVLDLLENFGKYVALNPFFPLVEAFIRDNKLEQLAPGEAVLESHQQMIDIQIPLQQPETFGLASLASLPSADYSVKKDLSFYHNGQVQHYITCPVGGFLIFFPQDAHAPCISQYTTFKKAIFKVRNM